MTARGRIYLVIRGNKANVRLPKEVTNKGTHPHKLNILLVKDVDSFTGLMIARHHWLPVTGFSLTGPHVRRSCAPRLLAGSYDSQPLVNVSIKDRSRDITVGLIDSHGQNPSPCLSKSLGVIELHTRLRPSRRTAILRLPPVIGLTFFGFHQS